MHEIFEDFCEKINSVLQDIIVNVKSENGVNGWHVTAILDSAIGPGRLSFLQDCYLLIAKHIVWSVTTIVVTNAQVFHVYELQ